MAGQVDFRVEKKGIIHCSVGRVSFSSAQLLDNVKALMLAISETKPDAIKGRYIKHVSLSSTMGPGIPLELPTVDPSSARFMLDPKMA
jgi:large subunit ribosomal protein L1